jgi:site-specific DNA-methyltransferase (adenine-specific)
VDVWREALRVLKPGGHALIACGTRTQHRMAVNVEDGGFEIRDIVAWVYGSGFPKSLDVSKAIDREAGAEREVVDYRTGPKPGNHGGSGQYGHGEDRNITAPATDAARQWDGWGTALKPAMELWTLARKPLIGTVAQNVQAWGTGGINVDACRVKTNGDTLSGGSDRASSSLLFSHPGWQRPWMSDSDAREKHDAVRRANRDKSQSLGRFPSNLIHDGSDEVLALFPVTTSGTKSPGHKIKSSKTKHAFGERERMPEDYLGSTGSAARFFYTAKASQAERDSGLNSEAVPAGGLSGRHDGSLGSVTMRKNHHPTVKPVALMRYLCRLIAPPGGIVLDIFGGSGTTALAAREEGFRFILCDRESEYVAIARARLAQPYTLPMFDAV